MHQHVAAIAGPHDVVKNIRHRERNPPMRPLLVLVACSFVLSGCDSSSTTAPARVVIGASSSPSDFRLIVNAPNTAVTLNSVTLHLLTGNNVGGPSITFPQ